jgi:hypothetical protein
MKNAICVIAAVAVLSMTTAAYSQASASPPFSLKLSVTPSTATAGSNFVVEVDLTNTSSQRIAIDICSAMRVECNFDISVRDSHENSPSETPYLKAVRGEPTGPPNLVILNSFGPKSIEPGETVKFVSNLPKLFDLSRPDLYEIQVERGDLDKKMTVKSNISHIVVSAQ